MKKTILLIMSILGISKLPVKDAATDFTPDQVKALEEALGGKVDVSKMLEAVNKELAEAAEKISEEDQRLIDAKQEIEDMLKAHGMSQEDLNKATEENNVDATALDQIKALIQNYTTKMDANLQKLLKESEIDTPEALIKKGQETMKHSNTHLFASNIDADAFEGRNWNQRAAGTSKKPTDWAAEGKVEIQTLKGDIDAFYRAFPDEIKSLHRDLMGLPAHWRIKTNVSDSAGDGSIVTGEATQARKPGWLPKNNQSIKAEKGKVYPVHVDFEFAGFKLQEIENNFVGDIYNKEGSQPMKFTFVRFLLKELDKQARLEDRIVAVKGVYVETPENATVPGKAIHRGDGLLITLWKAFHFDKKYKVALVGAPDENNIVDYVKAVIEKNMPEDTKNTQGLYFYLSPSWMRKYKERKRVIFGQDSNYNGKELVEIENYENFKFCELRDLEGTDFMFITLEDNIQLMENIPSEKSMYHFDSLKRQLFIFADYKWGSRFKHIGNKIADGDPDSFKVQTVWTNGLNPFNSDFFVRLYDVADTEIQLPYSNITVVDGYATAIATLKNVYAGQIVRIKGNTTATGKVTDDGNITLAGNADFNLSTGGILTLRVNDDLSLTEVKRTVTPPVLPTGDVSFAGTAIDANDGYVFNYTGGIATMTAILNGIDGQQIVINGGAGGALTLSDVPGNIEVGSGAVLANGADNITLAKIDGVWTEVNRTIA
jgi:hypothetical protein